jgi:hypothetical protein
VKRNSPRHRSPPRPSRDIAIVIAAKSVALALLYALFFGSAQRIAVDAASIEARLTAPETGEVDRVKP